MPMRMGQTGKDSAVVAGADDVAVGGAVAVVAAELAWGTDSDSDFDFEQV